MSFRSALIFPRRVFLFLWRKIRESIYRMALLIPYFHFVRNTINNGTACTFKLWFFQKILGFNRGVYWPVDHRSKINQWKHMCVGIDVAPGIEPGCYIQGIGRVIIGDYTRIAQNVGIISANHKLNDLREFDAGDVIIGKYCWLGMNSVVLPGVVLGDFTIVGAGSVVTKSFPGGHCVIAGNPARKVKDIVPDNCMRYTNEKKYHGYIQAEKFEEFRRKNLWIDC